jgi:hypothetical protein
MGPTHVGIASFDMSSTFSDLARAGVAGLLQKRCRLWLPSSEDTVSFQIDELYIPPILIPRPLFSNNCSRLQKNTRSHKLVLMGVEG